MEIKYIPSNTNHCQLYVQINPVTNPKGIVQLVHGMAEHIERYQPLITYLNQAGYLVVGSDTAAHGKSKRNDQLKGYFGGKDGWNHLIKDIYDIHQMVISIYPNLPYILFGHSMGSFLVRSYASKYHDCDGYIFCGTAGSNPALVFSDLIIKYETKRTGYMKPSTLIDRIAFGSYAKAIKNRKTNFDWISYNQDNVNKYLADENCGFTFTTSGYETLFTGLKEISQNSWYESVDHKPLLIIAGKDDPVGNKGKGPLEVSKKLKERNHDVTLILYENMRHEICNEQECDRVFADIVEFISKICN